MKQFEKVVNSREIYDGKILNLRVDEVELPDGRLAKREIVSHSGAVAVLPIHKGSIYFVKQYRIASGRLLTEIPAGLLEEGESPYDAAVRECQEEIGLRPVNLFKLGEILPTPGYCTEKITLYSGIDFLWDPHEEDEDEFIKVIKIPIRTVRALFLSGLFIDGKTTAALGYYFAMSKKT